MKENNIWSVTWSRSINEQDIETNADIEASAATYAALKFISLMPEVKWDKQELRVEKNYTMFLFRIEDNLLRRIEFPGDIT